MSIISKMDEETYVAVKKCVCPYCAVDLPFVLTSGNVHDTDRWSHRIPGTGEQIVCLAGRLRNARFDPASNPKENFNG